jgi:peptide/nickel transport system substrate-binding protein
MKLGDKEAALTDVVATGAWTMSEFDPSLFRSTRRAILLGGASAVIGSGARAAPAPPPAAKPPSAPKGQVVIGFSNEPTVFNPLMLGLSVDQGLWWNLFSPLWGVGPEGELFPVLAKEVPTVANGGLSGDGLVWKVRLRDDVKWHDGEAFTAADVKYTIELLQNPKFRAPSRAGHELVTDIRLVGEHEIEWRLKEPFSPYLSILAWTFMVPRHVLEKSDDPNTAAFNTAPVGTGPFKWGERRIGEHVILNANREYFGQGPYVERLIFRYVPDLTAMFTQFRTGQIDYLGLQGITPDRYAEAKTMPGRTIHVIPQVGVENVSLNLGRPALAEKAVRHALYAAIDKQSIIDALYYGLPSPVESYLPTNSWAYNDSLPKHEYSPAKANKLLDEAGWQRGSDGIRVKNGIRLQFDNSTVTGNQVREQTQLLLAQNWKAIGVQMKVNNMPGAVLWGRFWSHSEFDSLLTYTDATVASDPNVRHRFGSSAIPAKGGSGSNIYQFQDAEVDKLMDAAIRAPTREARRADYLQLQKIMRDQLVMLPLFQIVQIEGVKSNLMGFVPNINVRSNAWNAGGWYWG